MLPAADYQHVKTILEQSKTLLLTPHVGPDGDALGAMLGLYFLLTRHINTFDTVHMVVSGSNPDLYRFLPGMDAIINAETTPLLDQYDCAISLDCGSIQRLGAAQAAFSNAKASINLDHHISNDQYGTFNLVDSTASASGEVVADLIAHHQWPMDADMAQCLFVAILTDTGGFKYSNTTSKIFDLAALLTRAGANPEVIYRHVYEERPRAQALLHAHAVANAQFNDDASLAWVIITRACLDQFGAKDEHIEGLVELLRQIDTVKVSAVIKETKDGMSKVSLRSDVHTINVADIAARWNGGGHKMAAGASIPLPPPAFEAELLPLLSQAIQAG